LTNFHEDIISGVVGAVAGGAAGALTGWFVAPTQAEREERGRKRIEGRSQIASAVANLNYQLIEARGRLFRLEEISHLLDRTHFLEFANGVKRGSMFLHRFARFRVERSAKKLTGRLIWRLAEIVPPEHYGHVDEASVRQATADTRTSTDKPAYGPALAECPPTNARWDEALKILDKMKRTYPN
jgi:hypothetical protein